jgi:hypothetical protein
MRSRHLFEAPLAPTKRFIRFHGNYCGPGNCGGAPIDELDKACFKHDCEYDKSYRGDAADKRRRQHIADIHFVARCLRVAKKTDVPIKVRLKALVAARYFLVRISRCPIAPNLPNMA